MMVWLKKPRQDSKKKNTVHEDILLILQWCKKRCCVYGNRDRLMLTESYWAPNWFGRQVWRANYFPYYLTCLGFFSFYRAVLVKSFAFNNKLQILETKNQHQSCDYLLICWKKTFLWYVLRQSIIIYSKSKFVHVGWTVVTCLLFFFLSTNWSLYDVVALQLV